MVTAAPLPVIRTVKPLPLREGQILDAPTFHELYHRRPGAIKKIELIQGVVPMPSPAGLDHDVPHRNFFVWMNTYWLATPGADSHLGISYRPNLANEVQADGTLLILPKHGGRTRYFRRKDERYLKGIPELVLEVSKSSLKRDTAKKFKVYRAVGIPEYIVYDVAKAKVYWWHLVGGVYCALPEDAAGIIRSIEFPGLWLDTQSFAIGRIAAVLEILQQGLASPEHAAFVGRLAT